MINQSKILAYFLIGFSVVGGSVSFVCADESGEKPFKYNDDGRRDPFWNLVSPSGTVINYETDYMVGDLVLEGIMSGEENQSLAIINGRIVKVGDKIGNFAVLSVDSNKVILQKAEQKFELRLKKED